MTYQNIIYDKQAHIATITMNRPDKLNALNTDLMNEIGAAAEDAEWDEDVSVVILKGAGRAFSAGYDMTPVGNKKPALTMSSKFIQYSRLAKQNYRLWNLAKPVLAQVHGYCLAGGTDLALSCDIVICAQDAIFGLPDVRLQGPPPNHMWTYLVGPQWAKRLILTGDPIDGEFAERIGLVLKAVPLSDLEDEVRTLASRISKVPLDLLIPHKSLINKVMAMSGLGVAQDVATDTAIIATSSEASHQFSKFRQEKGLKEALKLRDTPFGDYSARPRGKSS